MSFLKNGHELTSSDLNGIQMTLGENNAYVN